MWGGGGRITSAFHEVFIMRPKIMYLSLMRLSCINPRKLSLDLEGRRVKRNGRK